MHDSPVESSPLISVAAATIVRSADLGKAHVVATSIVAADNLGRVEGLLAVVVVPRIKCGLKTTLDDRCGERQLNTLLWPPSSQTLDP